MGSWCLRLQEVSRALLADAGPDEHCRGQAVVMVLVPSMQRLHTPATELCMQTLTDNGAIMRLEQEMQPEANTLNSASFQDPGNFGD